MNRPSTPSTPPTAPTKERPTRRIQQKAQYLPGDTAWTKERCADSQGRRCQLIAAGPLAHNFMRMYMGKKLLELSNTPECAFKTRLYLNYKYFLDGRYPNSYANVAPTS